MIEKLVYSKDDVLELLDKLFQNRQEQWWDAFFSDHDKPCPFFVDWPDENLVEYFDKGILKTGRVLKLGCGHGRNALFLARHGCQVDAVDFSQKAISLAKERSDAEGLEVNFICKSIFEMNTPSAKYDLVYDAGCFHHLPPHRRESYVNLVSKVLKIGGLFGLTCFTPDGGSNMSDLEVYEQRSIKGGLGYTDKQIEDIFGGTFEILSFRKMKEMSTESELFGKDFLWVALMKN